MYVSDNESKIEGEPSSSFSAGKFWSKDPLKSFSTSRLMSRNESMEFCAKNNGTLFYWFNASEYQSLLTILSTRYFQIFSGQRRASRNETLIFHLGLKQINGVGQFESNSIAMPWNPLLNRSEDFCTMIHLNSSTNESIRLLPIDCQQTNLLAYPLCRLDVNHRNDDERFLYRLDHDEYSSGLTGLIDYCSQVGGDPIYATNAYEWQLIQGLSFSFSVSLGSCRSSSIASLHFAEIMFFDADFDVSYAYVGLRSPTKQLNDAYWMPRNRSVSLSDRSFDLLIDD